MKILLVPYLLLHLILLVFQILAILPVMLSHSYFHLLFCSWLVILNIFSCVYWPFINPLCVCMFVCTHTYNCLLMPTKLVTRHWNDMVPNSSPWQPSLPAENSQLSKKMISLAFQISYACMSAKSFLSCLTLGDPMEPTRLFCPLDFPGKNTGVGCHVLLWGIFLT